MENSQNENLPAVQKPTEVRVPEIVPLMDLGMDPANRNRISTNFSGLGFEAAKFITRAIANNGDNLDSLGSRAFPMKFYLAQMVDYTTESGEVLTMPRIILIGPSGETLAFTSEGAIRSLDLIRSLCGNGPWTPPLPVSAVPVRTRNNYRTFRLVLGEEKHDDQETDVHGSGDEPARKTRRS